MQTLTATYSPEDNKLRLYSTTRLDAATYLLVKEAGFRFAPKQDLFVAPMWTPEREDLLLQLCGEIGDEDKSLAERAEERAERFDEYSDKRAAEAHQAREAVASITAGIPLGQPILIGHHCEAHARRDAERIENGMRRAINRWDTARYWERRAQGAIAHAQYKERPEVRHRRIKGLEGDKRKHERTLINSRRFLSMWQRDGLTLQRAKAIADYDRVWSIFPKAVFPRSETEGSQSLRSALDKEIIGADAARELARKHHEGVIARAQRWCTHLDNRLAYERAMLGEAGGVAADRFDIRKGGRVLIGGEWVVVLRVNKINGRISSVTTTARYVAVRGIEQVRDYRPPAEGDAEKVAEATKLAPLANFPGEGAQVMTKAEWDRKPKDYRIVRTVKATETHGAYRYREAFVPGGNYLTARVYLSDAKRVDPPPAPAAAPELVRFERELAVQPAIVAAPAAIPEARTGGEFDAMRDQLRHGVQAVSAPQLFPTPAELACRVVDLADIDAGHTILEPEAGTGALLREIAERVDPDAVQLVAVEIDRRLASTLALQFPHVTTRCADFLACGPEDLGTFDRIVMNPPFVNAQDIEHITHALKFLKPGGRLVAICANGPRQQERLRTLVEARGGEWEALPPGAFEASGTQVRAALLTLDA